MASTSVEDECSICQVSLRTSEENVTTDCGHTFHRRCAQKRLDEKNLSDCKICQKPSAIVNALREYKASTKNTRSALRCSKSEEDKSKEISSVFGTTLFRDNDDESWHCESCSMENIPSNKRCESCGVPRYNSSITRRSVLTVDIVHADPRNSPLGGKKPNFDHDGYGHEEKLHPSSQQNGIVYIPDLPINIDDNFQLEERIRKRIEKILNVKINDIECYSKLGVGVIHVDTNEMKNRLIIDFGTLALDPAVEKTTISFVSELELTSYVVLEVKKEKKDMVMPSADEVSRRWNDIYKSEKPPLCEQLNAPFSNIYKIVSKSLKELVNAMKNKDFTIKDRFAQVYLRADCSFLEDLPRPITENQLQQAIDQQIQQANISSSFIYIQLNKMTCSACIIVTAAGRILSMTNYLMIDDKMVFMKNNLICRLCVYSVPESFSIRKIIDHEDLSGKVSSYKREGGNLILELSDKTIFNEYVERGVLRVDKHERFSVGAYTVSINPELCEIDKDTWYETEMLRYKPDIMQFITNPEHDIFQYRWNSRLWLKQFKETTSNNQDEKRIRDRKNTSIDGIRRQLQVTAMLNTLAVVLKKSYIIGDHKFILNIDKKMKTIVYDHRSKLEKGGKIPISKTPFDKTRIDVMREDCLVVYERLVKNGHRPLLLNMANATNPGGGYRRGDGAQEENLFRRSDYFRSLDVGLDQWLSEKSERFHCSSNCQLDPLTDPNNMYPMHEFGAIYTSGLTVFRHSEETGYAFMEVPLEGICSLAMAAYRDPKLDGNMLESKYAMGTRKKIENLFSIAYHQKHDTLVLSAFGCGAFKNPPVHVAKIFLSVIEQFAGFFKLITFAILDDHNAGHRLNPEGNYKPFKEIFDGLVVFPILPKNVAHTIFGPYRFLTDGVSVSDICIFDKTPCKFGANCTDIHIQKHTQEFSHPPLCPHIAIKGICKFSKDIVHTSSFIHPNQCQYGGECQQIDDKKHAREYEHPSYCPNGGKCQNMNNEHLKQYRHLLLCSEGLKCIEYQKHVEKHCNSYRHCAVNCRYGNQCAYFQDKKHRDEFEHPFPIPCPLTPFRCQHHTKLIYSTDRTKLDTDTHRHCLDFAHVCPLGRNCADKNPLHWEKSIHIARNICPDDAKCKNLDNEDHLNSFTHHGIPDIRELCEQYDGCLHRREVDHIKKYRHATKFEQSGILSYFNLNNKINFVQNQKDSIERIIAYVTSHKWQPLPSWNIPKEIINWMRTVQPVHRCNPIIFESILLHGHVMSRNYMINLKHPTFVANSVLQHSRIRRIKNLQERVIAERAKKYIIALICEHFQKKGISKSGAPADKSGAVLLSSDTYDDSTNYSNIIRKEERYLSSVITEKDLEAIRIKSIELANASIILNKNPAGIGFEKDKDLGTDKTVFSILGPHLGHYYGDVFIVFKREILHHPDANFTIQAATGLMSGNAFDLRPWLGNAPSKSYERAKFYNRTKLNASIPGYDYATALELIAMTSFHFKLKTMNIDLNKIFERWLNVDSHLTIEGHLPQLIPLSYIDHIYIPQNLYDSLSKTSHRAIQANFKHHITVVPLSVETDPPPGIHGPKPPTKSRAEYQKIVVEKLYKRFLEQATHPSWTSVQGAAITMASSDFTDPYILPLTISQAYDQYCFANKHPPPHKTYYIYWQVVASDMILTLSNEQIEPEEKQSNLRCLSCYLATKISRNDTFYYEHYSYVNDSPPSKHLVLRDASKFAAKSNEFFVSCNTDDLMTFCLEIQLSTNMVTLSHAGPNSIYNHTKISCSFEKSKLDLRKLNYVHISSGSGTVRVRNLIICFEKQIDLHPTFDKKLKKSDTKSSSDNGSISKSDKDKEKSSGIKSHDVSKLRPCHDNINCLLQHSLRHGPDHNGKFSHPCPFSELCRKKECYFTHERHKVSMCKYDNKCNKLSDPFHRAEYRHTDLPDFLIPCRYQTKCHEKSDDHRIIYSHGEEVYKTKQSTRKESRTSPPSPPPPMHKRDHDSKTSCQWGAKCKDIGDPQHCKTYSHPKPLSQSDYEDEQNDNS